MPPSAKDFARLTAIDIIKDAADAKTFVNEAGEGGMPDALYMRASVVHSMLARRGMIAPGMDDMDRAHCIALIAHGFSDEPACTSERAALFATSLPDA